MLRMSENLDISKMGVRIDGTFKMRYSEYSREAYDFDFCASESIILMLIFLAVNKPKINFVI
jgi:hypothetical protein